MGVDNYLNPPYANYQAKRSDKTDKFEKALQEIRDLSDRSIQGQYDYGEMIEAMVKIRDISKLALK